MDEIFFFFLLFSSFYKNLKKNPPWIEEMVFMVCRYHSSRRQKIIIKFNKSLGKITIQKEMASLAHVVINNILSNDRPDFS